MEVFVAQRGCYADRHVAGVFATVEAAKAAFPIPANPQSPPCRKPGWEEDEHGIWDNGLDWNEGVDITPYVVRE